MTMDVFSQLFDDAGAVARRRAIVVGVVDRLLGSAEFVRSREFEDAF